MTQTPGPEQGPHEGDHASESGPGESPAPGPESVPPPPPPLYDPSGEQQPPPPPPPPPPAGWQGAPEPQQGWAPPPAPGQQYPQPGYAAAQPAYGAPQGYGYDPAAPNGIHPQTGLPYSDKSKLVAGLLEIFVSGVGRMYMGQTGLGVAQLLVSIFTCGLGHIWSLVDGIMILVNDAPKDAQGRVLKQ